MEKLQSNKKSGVKNPFTRSIQEDEP